MNDVLDEIEVKNNQTIFSKLSLMISLISLGLISYLFLNIPKTIQASEGISAPSPILVTSTQIFCIVGLAMTILSFLKREPSTWMKWIGGILNILLFLLIIGSIIFTIVMDYYH